MESIDYDIAKWINQVPLDPDVHSWLIEAASTAGFKPNEYLGMILSSFYQGWKPPLEYGKANVQQKTYWIFRLEQRRAQMWRNLRRLAALVSEHETEEGVDALQEYCDLLNVYYDEVLADAKSDMFSALAKYASTSTKMGKCMRWLADLMQEHAQMPVKAIQAHVEGSQELSWGTVQRAKSQININQETPSFVSEKRGPIFWWVLIEDNDDQQQQLDQPIE